MGGDDVTLRIGGDSQGAKRALRDVEQGLTGTEAAAASASGGIASSGRAAGEAGKGFQFGGSEAERMAQALTMTGVVAPQLGSTLSYLLQFALNPVTLGFGAAVLAVQGLALAFRASAAETEEEQRRIAALAEAYSKAVAELEKLRRLRGEMTEAGAGRARTEQLAIAAPAGITEGEARQVLEAVPDATAAEAEALALAWAGRPAEERYQKLTPAQVARYFRGGRRGAERAEWEARARARVEADPTARLQALDALGKARREAALTEEDRLAQELATYYAWDEETADRMFRFGLGREGLGESLFARFFDRSAWERARGSLRRFARVRGGEVISEAGVDEWGPTLRINAQHYGGMDVHHHHAGGANPNVYADGRVRGQAD